jgi:alpha-tubulin suppressor-like RCC1 family protein
MVQAVRLRFQTAVAALAILSAGCRATIPEGRFSCGADGDCPGGWTCIAGFCRSSAVDAGSSGAPDAQADAGCSAPYQECDGIASTVCETDTATSRLHCGACYSVCSGTCRDGVCGGSPVRRVAAGGLSTCASTAEDRVSCWGNNMFGQLGRGDNTPHDDIVPIPSLLAAEDHQPIAVGPFHACAINQEQRLLCWGSNASGQLGLGTGAPGAAYSPTMIPSPSAGWTHVVAGGSSLDDLHSFTCAANGNVIYCWGDNTYGQLGTGDTTPRNRPTPVTWELPAREEVHELSAGDGHVCVILMPSGALYCWGANEYGQLGDGTRENRLVPTIVSLPAGAASVGAGLRHTCAMVSGQAFCWGWDHEFQVGNDTVREPKGVVAPTQVRDFPFTPNSGPGMVGAGSGTSYALSGGRTYAWGANGENQLGSESAVPGESSLVPIDVAVPRTETDAAREISAGAGHVCTVHYDGALYCWGANGSRQVTPVTDWATPIRLPVRVMVP